MGFRLRICIESEKEYSRLRLADRYLSVVFMHHNGNVATMKRKAGRTNLVTPRWWEGAKADAILYPAAALVSLCWKPSILSRVELLTRQPRKNLPVIGSLLPERGRKNGD